MHRILTIFGTRPEAIKLAPVVLELEKAGDIESMVCVTAQHREMLDQVLGIFGIEPDIDLDLMTANQSLAALTARVVGAVSDVLVRERPDMVIVQGDTTTTMAAALAAFYNGVEVGHVEAGLRSDDIHSPFPEELNRRIATLTASLHFAPTQRAADALKAEGVDTERIFIAGNPVIDALEMILERPAGAFVDSLLARAGVGGGENSRRLILVTAHRRENFGRPIRNICKALKELASRNADITVVYPTHLNPNISGPVHELLGGVENVLLIDPVDYSTMAHLINAAYMVLTDSGGIQEEAPALGKPVLVMRSETERPEGIEVGTARLVGTDPQAIISQSELLLGDERCYREMARAVNPYGDGAASRRIVEAVLSRCERMRRRQSKMIEV